MRLRRPPAGVTGGRPARAVRGFLPHPGRVLGAATAALLLTLPVLTATRWGWLLGASPGLLVAAYTAVGRRRRG
ncbi:hypothetical protein AB0J20_11000 [Micromonospora costi]|uniref:hypothetical protein n=1 Tax=Micromonospora costi TaxID=1530042 RepID=UPI00340B3AFA